MSASAINIYRDNVRRLQSSGQWINIGADHGIPNQYCPHGNLKFLVWHRRQIARIEEMLGVPLPYWDWTKTNGIPEPCKSRTYTDNQGVRRSNPLYAGPKIGGGNTRRQRLPDFNMQSLLNQEQMAMGSRRFEDFSTMIEGAHNDVHGDIGGDMNSIDYAAFDPIFWLHHNNIDRIWYRWQRRNKFAIYPDIARSDYQDSLGIFMGEDVINDLSGWMPGSKQPNVSASDLPTMSSQGSISGTQFQALQDDPVPNHVINMNAVRNSSNQTNAKAPAYLLSLKSIRHPLHGLQTPLQIQTDVNDDPDLFTSVEQPGYQAHNRSVLKLKGIEGGSDPLRIDIYLSGQLITWIQTFAMGHSNMTYIIDRFIDITQHSQKCSHDNIKDQVKFRITNQRTGQVDVLKTFDLELVNMIF